MQGPLSISISILLLIMAMASYGDKEVSKKVWSTLLNEDMPVIKGVGTWKIRISEIKKPYEAWTKSKEPMSSQKTNKNNNTVTVHKYLTDHASSNVVVHKTNNADSKISKDYDVNFFLDNDIESDNTDYTRRSVSENKEKNPLETYKNWIGNHKEHENYISSNFSQPTWQLPVSKFNETREKKENLTVYPLSVMHKVWQKTDQIKRIDELYEDDFAFENETFFKLSEKTHLNCKNECLIHRSGSEIPKGDLGTSETFQERMGGGQPILLIKDKGDSGWSDMAHPMNKDALGPLIMMMSPLIMMCIMIPMMMSIMGGMMSFMKSMTTLLMMLTWPQNSSQPLQALVTKQRKISEINQNRTNEFLSSFILELSERLDEALSKYDN